MFWKRRKTFRYTCACCGDEFEGAPSFSHDLPAFAHDVPEEEREGRILIASDLCRIRARLNEDSDDDIFAIRVNLEIPIHHSPDPFLWGVWVTQSKESFFRYLETYDDDQSGEASFGWLPVTMAHYREFDATNFRGSLACDVNWGPRGQRPTILLHESDHPLFVDQANGIGWDKAIKIAQECMRAAHEASRSQ